MIDSTSSSAGVSGTNALTPGLHKSTFQRSDITRDQLSTDGVDKLRNLIASEPEVRPEVVEKGRALAADPDYPSSDVVQRMAGLLVNSPDLSDDLS